MVLIFPPTKSFGLIIALQLCTDCLLVQSNVRAFYWQWNKFWSVLWSLLHCSTPALTVYLVFVIHISFIHFTLQSRWSSPRQHWTEESFWFCLDWVSHCPQECHSHCCMPHCTGQSRKAALVGWRGWMCCECKCYHCCSDCSWSGSD